jgi:hypothetical protein
MYGTDPMAFLVLWGSRFNFGTLGFWFPWSLVLLGVAAALFTYIALLLVRTLVPRHTHALFYIYILLLHYIHSSMYKSLDTIIIVPRYLYIILLLTCELAGAQLTHIPVSWYKDWLLLCCGCYPGAGSVPALWGPETLPPLEPQGTHNTHSHTHSLTYWLTHSEHTHPYPFLVFPQIGIVVTLAFSVTATAILSDLWSKEWKTLLLSLQVGSPTCQSNNKPIRSGTRVAFHRVVKLIAYHVYYSRYGEIGSHMSN